MPSAAFVNHYAVLGLEHGCEDRAIIKAYRKLALRMHPDKNREDVSAPARFDALKVRRRAAAAPSGRC